VEAKQPNETMALSGDSAMDYGSRGPLVWFMAFTSIGGLSQSHLSDLRWSKLVWLLLFMAGVILTAQSVHDVITDYYSFPVSDPI
jgi:hypothetical protein